MMTCSSRRSFWTVLFLGLLFAAFIGGTQFPIQFTIGKRAEYVPVTLVPESNIAPAGYGIPEVPTSVAYNAVTIPPVVQSPVEPPITEPPPLNTIPVPLPPVMEASAPAMPSDLSPTTSNPPPIMLNMPAPTLPTPQFDANQNTAPKHATPGIFHTAEPPSVGGKQLEEICFAQPFALNIENLTQLKSQRALAEKELKEFETALKQRLNRANDDLNDKEKTPDKQPESESPMADKSIDQLVGNVKRLRVNNSALDQLTSTLKRVIRTQFDDLQKQVKEMGIMDVEPLVKPTVPPPM